MHLSRNLIVKWTQVLGSLAFGTAFWACSANYVETSGTSEESEGIVALASKNISGAVQKGPFVKGSEVILRETSADGKLEPTGREFTTKTINDDGDFAFDKLDLESQYALLSAEGHYTHDINGERSHCVLHLNAVSNLEKRNTANINLLTHFEYKRVLYLVKHGKTFAEAKRQATTEVLNAFGVDVHVNSAEDLNIYHSTDADRTLYHISVFVDGRDFYYPMGEDDDEWEYRQNPDNIDCSALQNYVDSYAEDLAEDGTLSDSLIAPLAYSAYLNNRYFGNSMYVDETGLRGRDKYELMAERIYFYDLVLDHYLDFEKCNEKRWGESRKLDKPFYDDDREEYVNPAYFLCDGLDWMLTTKGHIDSLKMPIPHGSGTMTDPRDGKKYKTLSFEFGGKNYEWMAEDLKYVVPSDIYNGKKTTYVVNGLYSWTNAMQIDNKYMSKPVPEGLIDSVHQGICPDGWHVSSTLDWEALVAYVQGAGNLLDENWRTDPETAKAKDVKGVFFNRFDFNLLPMDKYLETAYHTYTHESFGANTEAELDSLWEYYYGEDGSTSGDEWTRGYLDSYRNNRDVENKVYEISVDHNMAYSDPRKKAHVRCVKN